MEIRRLNLDFLEGIIIGIYGNWLIALIAEIDFERILSFDFGMLYLGMLFLSFVAFIGYFVHLIGGGVMTTLRQQIVLMVIHYGGWLTPYLSQGITIKRTFFSFVGVLLFGALLQAERRRLAQVT